MYKIRTGSCAITHDILIPFFQCFRFLYETKKKKKERNFMKTIMIQKLLHSIQIYQDKTCT